MDSISRELNLGIQTMASRVRVMHLYYGADGHLLWTSHGTESIYQSLNIHRHWLCLIAVCTAPISKCTLFNLFFLVPSGLDCAPANSSLLWIWCAHVHRLFFALLVPVAAKVQCQTSTSVVLSSPNGDHHNLCPIVSKHVFLSLQTRGSRLTYGCFHHISCT